jgi:hypothetical protein
MRPTLLPGEKEGPIAQQWEDEGVRRLMVVPGAVTPHPPAAFGAGPSLSLWERCARRGR